MTETGHSRRAALGAGGIGFAGGMIAAGTGLLGPRAAYAQAASESLLRTVLDRGHLIVGTGSTNAPWHFEDEQGQLTGMDIAMARILAKGLFDDESKVEFVLQDPAARIPNVISGKVDITIQFMTVTPQRAQLVNFARPYYVEGVSLLSKPGSPREKWDALVAGGADTKISILQNVDAEEGVHKVLPQAQVLQLDTQANVIQALEAGRVDAGTTPPGARSAPGAAAESPARLSLQAPQHQASAAPAVVARRGRRQPRRSLTWTAPATPEASCRPVAAARPPEQRAAGTPWTSSPAATSGSCAAPAAGPSSSRSGTPASSR